MALLQIEELRQLIKSAVREAVEEEKEKFITELNDNNPQEQKIKRHDVVHSLVFCVILFRNLYKARMMAWKAIFSFLGLALLLVLVSSIEDVIKLLKKFLGLGTF